MEPNDPNDPDNPDNPDNYLGDMISKIFTTLDGQPPEVHYMSGEDFAKLLMGESALRSVGKLPPLQDGNDGIVATDGNVTYVNFRR